MLVFKSSFFARYAKTVSYATLLLLVALLTTHCATYFSQIKKPKKLFYSKKHDDATKILLPLTKGKDKDLLLYLMDLGTIYHVNGEYEKAIDIWLKASKLITTSEYTSLSEEGLTVLVNEDTKPYYGEDFEKVLISTFLALDYVNSKNFDEALVECRKIDRVIETLISQNKAKFGRNKLAKYLSASLFENENEINDAYVNYRELYRWDKDTPFLAQPLLRLAKKMDDTDRFERYQAHYGDIPFTLKKSYGEVIAIIELGKAPTKIPDPAYRLLAQYKKEPYHWTQAEIALADKTPLATLEASVRAQTLFDVEQTAFLDHEDKKAKIIAKKIAGTIAKEGAGFAVEKTTKSPLLGSLTSLTLMLMDHADLRSWTTLPAKIMLARMALPQGHHTIVLELLSDDGEKITAKEWNILIQPQKLTYLNFREID